MDKDIDYWIKECLKKEKRIKELNYEIIQLREDIKILEYELEESMHRED